jgi:hypothetical protein
VSSILGGEEMVQPINESTRQELLALTSSDDLMDLARQLREQGVESLLICRPGGRIAQVVTDRQIAQLATAESGPSLRFETTQPAVASPPVARNGGSVVPQTRRPDDALVPVDLGADHPKVKEYAVKPGESATSKVARFGSSPVTSR